MKTTFSLCVICLLLSEFGIAAEEPQAIVDSNSALISRAEAPTTSSPAPLRQASIAPGQRSIYFDRGSFVIKPEYRNLLIQQAKFLAEEPGAKIFIHGHCDERGSRESNLKLGQKRAEAIKVGLLMLGAAVEKIESGSLGEENPVCAEQTEECWERNRRAEIRYGDEF